MKNKHLSSLFALILLNLLSCIPDEAPKISFKKAETFYNNLSNEPENLHPIKSTDGYSSTVQSYIIESLLEADPDTYKPTPLLAYKWTIKPDQKTFIFYLYKDLKWSDGKPLTAHDVKFSFDARKDPEYGGITSIPYYEKLTSATVLNNYAIEFKAKEIYFGNFQVISGMKIIPKHIYHDPKLKLSKTVIGSGPYKIGSYLRGKRIVLVRNKHWKRRDFSTSVTRHNFKNIVLRFVSEETDQLLRMQKGDLDFTMLTAEAFTTKTIRRPWGTKIKKYKIINKQPKSYSYIGLNLKKYLFKDKKVRQAMTHLMNRKFMNEKFFFNSQKLATGPWYPTSVYADPSVKPLEYDPKKAHQLLLQAGWSDSDRDGILDRTINGQKVKFSFTLFFSNKDSEKYATVYKENLKSAGIEMNIKNLDWTSFLKLIDDRNFDAVMLGWGGGSVDLDPKQIWHSTSSRHKGSNFISYSNAQVDVLIDKGRRQLNKQERIKTFQKVYRLIANDAPYIFMFSGHYKFYGVNERIQIPKPTFLYTTGIDFWKLQP